MKNPKIYDERIEKISNKKGSSMYVFMILLLIILLFVKIVRGFPIERYLLEIICLSVSCIYLIMSLIKYRINLFIKSDTAIGEIKAKILSQCGMLCFWIVISGELILLLLGCLHSIDVLFYIITWGIPALIITAFSIRHGLLIWGGAKRQKTGKEALAKRTAIGALFFGIITGGSKFYYEGAFHANGLIWILGMALGWGIPFYLIFCFIIDQAEKNADKQVEDAELEAEMINEEQENENS